LIAVINLSLAVAGHQLDPDRQQEEEKARHEREMEFKKKKHQHDMELGRLTHQLESERLQQESDLELDRLAHNKKVEETKNRYSRSHTDDYPKPMPQPQAEDQGIKDMLRKALGMNDSTEPTRTMAADGKGIAAPKVKAEE
jgi:hypothetical protein